MEIHSKNEIITLNQFDFVCLVYVWSDLRPLLIFPVVFSFTFFLSLSLSLRIWSCGAKFATLQLTKLYSNLNWVSAFVSCKTIIEFVQMQRRQRIIDFFPFSSIFPSSKLFCAHFDLSFLFAHSIQYTRSTRSYISNSIWTIGTIEKVGVRQLNLWLHSTDIRFKQTSTNSCDWLKY